MKTMLDRRQVFLVGIDEDDRFITSSVFSDSGFDIEVAYLEDSMALKQSLSLNARNLPVLIILDYHLFAGDSMDSLRYIKEHPDLKHIPVIMVSDSVHPSSVLACYKAGANTFFSKPTSDRSTTEKIQHVLAYWLNMAELPKLNH